MALKENKYAVYIYNLISLYNIKYSRSNKILYVQQGIQISEIFLRES